MFLFLQFFQLLFQFPFSVSVFSQCGWILLFLPLIIVKHFLLEAGILSRLNRGDRLPPPGAERDPQKVAECLERVEAAARGTDNLVPPILEAVKAHATHGELCNVLRNVFGTYHPDSLTTGV